MTTLEALLRERIGRSGPIPFAAYMSQALYEPGHGYYATGAARTDWSGHYVTSPEIDPGYAQLWMGSFEKIWVALDRPAPFTIVEVGPGEAGFAVAALAFSTGRFGDALRYVLIERSSDARERQAERLRDDQRVSWVSSITDLAALGCGIVFMNEVVDNLPVHLVRRRDDDIVELHVGIEDGALAFRDGPASSPQVLAYLERLGVALPNGHLAEVGLAAESLVARASRALDRGAIVIVDYGAEAEDLVQRPNGSLACYSASGVDDRPLERPGDKDITVHANWTSLRSALQNGGFDVSGPTTQRDVLKSLGIAELDAALRSEFQRATSEGRGAEGVRALSRRQALGALLDPGGLGGLGVLVGARGFPPDALPFQL